ncbi:MAG: sigma 54-interacting transcriptional regulator [Sandaracinaceae bacterium]
MTAGLGTGDGLAIPRPQCSDVSPSEQIVGRSEELLDALALARRVAATDLPVLIVGETGTGKELVAQLVHHASGRKGPMVSIDCGALPEELGESLLFGHRRGAFTGAVQQTDGLIASAEDGTLFMDELSNLSLGGQAMLLRAIETRHIRRLGDARSRAASFRLVATAQDSLTDLLQGGRFRADLMQRVSGVLIRLPSLRERGNDVAVLAHHFASQHGLSLQADACRDLVRCDWPGNVRELRATVARCALFSAGDEIGREAVRLALTTGPASLVKGCSAVGDPAEAAELRALCSEFGGDADRIAAALNVSRATLYRRLRARRLRLREFRVEASA